MNSGAGLRFAELAATTCFSFLAGGSHPDEMVERACELELPALGIVDRDGLYGLVRAYEAVRRLERAGRAAPKLIAGATLTLSGWPGREVVLLVEDRRGYANLCALLTRAHAERPKGEAELDVSFLAEHAGGLIALVTDGADVALAASLREHFGRGRAYALACRRLVSADGPRVRALRALAARFGLPVVASGRPLFHDRSRRPLLDVMRCIRAGTTLDEAGRLLLPNDEAVLRSGLEVAGLFADEPGWVAASATIAERCAFRFDELEYRFPGGGAGGEAANEALGRAVRERLPGRYPRGVPGGVASQIDRELGLIAELAVAPYFLSVFEVVEIARRRGILCQGRGSAANSAVCYALGITAVDPARSSLLFERFLSPERREPPDIDVDFEHERREEVIQEIYGRYGRDRAAMVSEVICYRSRSALRDAGRAFGLPPAALTRLAGLASRWGEAGGLDAAALREAGLDPAGGRLQALLAIAAALRGMPRHLSIHVGGFVLSAEPLARVAPVEPARMPDRTVIPWDKDDLDVLGFFKIDVLGLGILTAVRKAYELLGVPAPAAAFGRGAGGDPAGAIEGLFGGDDPDVYDAFCRADTLGVFQIESRAQMAMLPRLKPRSFYDLVVEVALVRPGPIQGGMVHPYLRRREGLEPVRCPHPLLDAILERTLGVPLFQEQVMQVAMAGAGYTGGEADELRRDMASWRRRGRLDRHRQRLVEGFSERGIGRSFAEALFRQIEGFGEYGFPESHAASFALLVYVTGWLKVRHPVVFACALLNSQPLGFYGPSAIVQDAQRHGAEVRQVCALASSWDCTLETGGSESRPVFGLAQPALRLGLRLVKGLGEAEGRALVEARARSSFEDFDDLVDRARPSRAALEALAEAGALERLVPGRRAALWQAWAPRGRGLFRRRTTAGEAAPALRALTAAEQLVLDYARTSLSVDDHPLRHWRATLDRQRVRRTAELASLGHGVRASVAGLVQSRQRPGSAGGVVFLTLEDETGSCNVVLWARVFERYRALARAAKMLVVSGRVERDGAVVHLVARSLEPLQGLGPSPTLRSRDFR
ncbi:MAG: error-prone DNA polymerase [Polyangiaceae bacterium]|nr:error-prone DNA polymerase [Polyangiaceae bacterium]